MTLFRAGEGEGSEKSSGVPTQLLHCWFKSVLLPHTTIGYGNNIQLSVTDLLRAYCYLSVAFVLHYFGLAFS